MLRADPIFFRSLIRGRGRRRVAFQVENLEAQPFVGRLTKVECAEWLYLERPGKDGADGALFDPMPGAEDVPEEARKNHPGWLVIPPGRRVQLIATVDTDHQFFPRQELPKEKKLTGESGSVICEFEGEDELEIPWTVAELTVEMDDFDGMFALDFGTTNSCFAFKRRRGGPEALERPPRSSAEIPSVIYFDDLRTPDYPGVLVGKEARLEMLKNPSRVYAYSESIKRLLGSNTKMTMLDSRGRSALYTPQQVASFLVRAVLDEAQNKDLEGRRIQRVIATFPTLFSPRRRRAVQDAILGGLRLLDPRLVPAQWLDPDERSPEDQEKCDALVELRVDEANAACFRYITGPLLEACFRFGRDQANDVLTYDFGGGTIDVSYLRVTMERNAQAKRTVIDTKLLGVTGESNYGGDNVSIELVRLLRSKLAVAAARKLVADEEAKAAAAAKPESEDSGAGGGGGGGFLDMIRKAQEAEQREAEAKAAAEAAAAAAAAKGDDDEPEDEFAPPPHADRLGRARLIAQHAELILEATREGILEHELAAEGEDGCLQRLSELLRKDAQEKKRPFNPDEAKEVDEALEAFLPTRFGRYADSDPTMERRAKVLYMDLWREANDRLKPLLVARCGGEISASAAAEAEAKVQEPLERAATYVGVEPELWNKEVSLTLAELEAMIGPRVKRSITKARELYTTARDEEQQGPVGGGGGLLGRESGGGGLLGREGSNGGNGGLVPTKVQVLLAGNSSILPIVRRSFDEVFAGIDHELVWDERNRKTAVAQGAVEECLLSREFGNEGGGIHFRTVNFLERLPFSMGLYSRFLGFIPLFKRGTEAGEMLVLDAREYELVSRGMEDLTVYADYHDGAPVRYLGVFDFRRSEGRAATEEEAALLGEPEDGDGGSVYRPVIRLLSDWEVQFIDSDTRRVYRLSLEDVTVDPREDPFSGQI